MDDPLQSRALGPQQHFGVCVCVSIDKVSSLLTHLYGEPRPVLGVWPRADALLDLVAAQNSVNKVQIESAVISFSQSKITEPQPVAFKLGSSLHRPTTSGASSSESENPPATTAMLFSAPLAPRFPAAAAKAELSRSRVKEFDGWRGAPAQN